MDMPVRQFIRMAIRLVNPSNPTVPLHGTDLSIGIEAMNLLLSSKATSGLLLPIAKTYTIPVYSGDGEIIVGPSSYTPTPDIVSGRMSNANEAWLELNGVTYPLVIMQKEYFLESYKYEPLSGLPCFLIVFQEDQISRLRLYPSPSQFYDFYIRGKFQLSELAANDSMQVVPDYYLQYLQYAVAKAWAFNTGRSEAWTDSLEAELTRLRLDIQAASEINLSIRRSDPDRIMLNGAARARAGV